MKEIKRTKTQKRIPFRRGGPYNKYLFPQEHFDLPEEDPSSEEDLKRVRGIRLGFVGHRRGARKAIKRMVRQKNAAKFMRKVKQIPNELKPIILNYL